MMASTKYGVLLLAAMLGGVFLAYLLLVDSPHLVEGTPGAEIRIATWNLEWFYDDARDSDSVIGDDFAAPNRGEYQDRVHGVAGAIYAIDPTLIALQEIENARVLQDLADRLLDRHGAAYQAVYVTGRDTHTGQDVAVLVKTEGWVSARRFDFSAFRGRRDFKDLSKHLVVETSFGGEDITFVAVHLSTNTRDRQRQARTLRAWIDDLAPTTSIVILGDFNARQPFNQTTPDSELGIIRGFQTPMTTDDLFDAHARLIQQGTHISGRALDRVLLSPSLLDATSWRLASVATRRDLVIRGRVDAGQGVDYAQPFDEQDLSDHFPLVVTLFAAY